MAMSVALVSASREIRSSFATVIAEAPEVTLAGIAGTMPDLRTLVQETPELDVIVVDAGLTDTPALEVVHELGLSAPLIATLVIGGQGVTLAAVVASGARGMLTLPLSLQEVQAQLDTAVAWSRSLRQHLTGELTAGGRGRILALAGAKGGVGVSVLAALLATRAAGEGQTVCLVDLDLRAGDLAFLCGVSPRRSVADLAGLAGDLTIRGIREVVVDVPAGFALLAAPDRVEQSEEVTAQAVRQILHELRRNFSLVVVDTGSVLDDPRAVALEVADEVLLVANCELISIRAARRSLEAWERLGVRTTDRARLVVNQSSKQREIQPDLVARLVKLPLLTAVASAPAEFEGPVNTGTLTGERPATGMQAAGAILAGCGTDAPALRQATSAGRGPASRRKRSRAGSRVLVEESGSSAVELPVFVLLFMITFFICIQGLVLGLGYIVAGNAANEAAREASVGRSLAEIDQVSQHAMLGLEFSANTRVDAGARVVTVDVGVPKVFGWLPDGLQAASARAAYLPEDDS